MKEPRNLWRPAVWSTRRPQRQAALARWLLAGWLALCLAACDNPPAPDQAVAPSPAEDAGSAAKTVDDELSEAPPVKATDKRAIISYTEKNQHLGEQVGAPGGTPGLVPLDTNGLSDKELAALAQAREVLAQHLELPDVDAAELIEISAQQWRNSGLGCSGPGEMSAQVMTDGYKVVLVLAGLRHQVHTGRRGGRVCERLQGMLQMPRRAMSMSVLPQLQRQAISDLAGRLKVPESAIRAGRVRPARWPDASLGCPEAGVSYAQVVTAGHFLPLLVNGKTVTYRTDGVRVVMCDSLDQIQAQEM